MPTIPNVCVFISEQGFWLIKNGKAVDIREASPASPINIQIEEYPPDSYSYDYINEEAIRWP